MGLKYNSIIRTHKICKLLQYLYRKCYSKSWKNCKITTLKSTYNLLATFHLDLEYKFKPLGPWG